VANEQDADAFRFAAGAAGERIEDLGQRSRAIEGTDGIHEAFVRGELGGSEVSARVLASFLSPPRERLFAAFSNALLTALLAALFSPLFPPPGETLETAGLPPLSSSFFPSFLPSLFSSLLSAFFPALVSSSL